MAGQSSVPEPQLQGWCLKHRSHFQPLQYGGHSRRQWSKCQTSIHYGLLHFKQTTVLFWKGLFTNSTQEKMVSSGAKLNVHSEMDKFIKQDCPEQECTGIEANTQRKRDENSLFLILPIEESTKVSTLYLFMWYLEHGKQYIVRRWGIRANSSLFHRVMAQGLV